MNSVRVFVFWAAFLALQVGCSTYAALFIELPWRVRGRVGGDGWKRSWNRLCRFWGRATFRLCVTLIGIDVEIEGEPPEGRCIVVANHQSTVDIPILQKAFDPRNTKFIVKKQLLSGIPFVSSTLGKAGYGVVDFDDQRSTIQGLLRFARNLESWEGSPVIYPEGIRSIDGEIARFHGGGIRLLVRKTDLPIVPVVVDGVSSARTSKDFARHLSGARCRVRILPAIPSGAARSDLENLPRKLEERLRSELARMRA